MAQASQREFTRANVPPTPYGEDPANGLPQAKVITHPNRPIPGATAGMITTRGADALEDAIWSARRDTDTGYGVAVFDLDPAVPGSKTSMTIRYYHAIWADQIPTGRYELFEILILAKDRRDKKLG